MKISNRKDSGREDAPEDCPDDHQTTGGVASLTTPAEVNKSPTSSSHQDVLSAAKEAPTKSPEPTTANTPVVIPTAAATSQVPSASPAVASKTSSSSAKSHSSQSASMVSS